jgi:hypothetical protein
MCATCTSDAGYLVTCVSLIFQASFNGDAKLAQLNHLAILRM